MFEHFFCYSTFFNYTAFRSDVTGKNCDTASFAIGFFNSMDNIRTSDSSFSNGFANSFVAYGDAFFIDETKFIKFVHYCANAASFVQVDDVVAATGAKLGKIRSFLGDYVETGQGKFDASFVCDCRQVKCGVGAAANCHVYGDCIVESSSSHNVARTDIFFYQVHDCHTCVFSKCNALTVVSCRNGTVAGKTHTQNFGQAVHGVSSEETGAATATGASAMFDFAKFSSANLTGFKTTSSFEYGGYADVFAIHTTGKHRTATYNNSRDVQASSCHEHTGNNFIAVGDEYQTVKSVTVSNSFNAICYQFAACEGIFHAIVTHCDTVANTDSREFDRSTASFQDAVFNSLSDGVQVHMTGDDFVSCTANAD